MNTSTPFCVAKTVIFKNSCFFNLGMFINRCERCLLITESPKTPGHYRYLSVGPRLHPLYGIGGVQIAIARVPVYTAISKKFRFVFSTLQSRSCLQLTNSCLHRGHPGLLLWIDILSFCYQLVYFRSGAAFLTLFCCR